MWKHLCLALILALGLLQPAFGGVLVSVDARATGGPSDQATTAGQFPGAKIVSGSAFADADGASAIVKAGIFDCGEPGQIPCATSGAAGGSGFTRAQANGLAGSLRARAQASADAFTDSKRSGATAALTDTITFSGAAPVVKFDIDLSSTLIGEGISRLSFRFVLKNNEPDLECEEAVCGLVDTTVARLTVDESRLTGNIEPRRFYKLEFDDSRPTVTGDILDHYQFTYDLGEHQAPSTTSFEILAELIVSAFAGTDTFDGVPGFAPFGSFARMAADQSVFVEIDNVISANGYNYPGRISPPSVVPVPASLALFAIGLAGLAGVARRRKR